MSTLIRLDMPIPRGEDLKAARIAAGLNQAQAAELELVPRRVFRPAQRCLDSAGVAGCLQDALAQHARHAGRRGHLRLVAALQLGQRFPGLQFCLGRCLLRET